MLLLVSSYAWETSFLTDGEIALSPVTGALPKTEAHNVFNIKGHYSTPTEPGGQAGLAPVISLQPWWEPTWQASVMPAINIPLAAHPRQREGPFSALFILLKLSCS